MLRVIGRAYKFQPNRSGSSIATVKNYKVTQTGVLRKSALGSLSISVNETNEKTQNNEGIRLPKCCLLLPHLRVTIYNRGENDSTHVVEIARVSMINRDFLEN